MRRAALCVFLVACGAPAPRPTSLATPPAAEAPGIPFEAAEPKILELLSASDPRVAQRTGISPSEATQQKIQDGSILAEDAEARVRGGSLDLFAFRGRARVLKQAREILAASRGGVPLERELLERLVATEEARTAIESRLGDESASLVRAMVTTWSTPASPGDRDAWVAKRLAQVRGSLATAGEAAGPSGLEEALYPLERLVDPAIFPRAVVALTELRVALADDRRVPPKSMRDSELAARARDFLGVTTPPAELRRELARAEEIVAKQLGARPDIEARIFVSGRCDGGSPARALAPPPERLAICGTLRALASDGRAALAALHDEVVAAMWALGAPDDVARLAAKLDEDRTRELRRFARTEPLVAIGVGAAALLLMRGGEPQKLAERAAAWLAFGDAPLDVVARELFSGSAGATGAAARAPGAPRP